MNLLWILPVLLVGGLLAYIALSALRPKVPPPARPRQLKQGDTVTLVGHQQEAGKDAGLKGTFWNLTPRDGNVSELEFRRDTVVDD